MEKKWAMQMKLQYVEKDSIYLMCKNLLLLIIVIFVFNTLSQAQGVSLCIVNDSVIAKLKGNKIETIELNIRIENNTNNAIIIRKQTGILEVGSLTGELLSNFCELSDYMGTFRKFIFFHDDKPLEEFNNILGMHVYFTKAGKIKYSKTSGFVNPRKLKRRLEREFRHQEKAININLDPNENLTYKIKIYLGNYKFEKKQHYYLVIVYNNKTIDSLSQICLKSNRIKIITN